MTSSFVPETDIFKPLPAHIVRGDSNEWPIFGLEDVEILSANTGKPVSLFDAHRLNPVVLRGTLSDVEKGDQKLLKTTSWKNKSIEIAGVTMYAFSPPVNEDGTGDYGIGLHPVWASNRKSGWFEITSIKPSYQWLSKSMSEALSIWYYLVDNFTRHRQSKKSKADQLDLLIQGYYRSSVCKLQSKDKVKPAILEHKWFLMKSMHEGLDDCPWSESFLYRHLKEQYTPEFERAGRIVRGVVDKPSSAAEFLRESGQEDKPKADRLDSLFDLDAEAPIDDKSVAENTKANKKIIEKSSTYRPHKRRKTVHEQEQLKSDSEESSSDSDDKDEIQDDDDDDDDAGGIYLSDEESSKPRHAKSQLRLSTQASKTLGARHLQSPTSQSHAPRARNESSSDSEAGIIPFRPSKTSSQSAPTRAGIQTATMEPNISRQRQAPIAPMMPASQARPRPIIAPMSAMPRAKVNPPHLAKHVPATTTPAVQPEEPRTAGQLHPESTVDTRLTSTWTCHFSGCNHKVYAELPGSIQTLANEHIRLEHLDAIKEMIVEEGESFTREGQPWKGAEHLMRKVKALEKNAKANGQKTTEGVVRMW